MYIRLQETYITIEDDDPASIIIDNLTFPYTEYVEVENQKL